MNKELAKYAKAQSVYIVDHIPLEEEYLVGFLEQYYKKIARNSDAKSALEALKNSRYDIVVLPASMRSMNTQTFIRELRKTNIKSSIVITIAQKEIASIITYIQLGMKEYILKPFNDIQAQQACLDVSRYIFEQKALYTKSHNLAKFVLDSQVNINILTNGKSITYANSAFYRFFDDIATIEEFESKYKSIGNLFEHVDSDEYVYNGKEGKDWLRYLIDNKDYEYKVKIDRGDVAYIFALKLDINKELKEFVVSFVDITAMEIEAQSTKNILKSTKAKLKEQEIESLKNYKLSYIDELLDHIQQQISRPIDTIKAINQEMYTSYKTDTLSSYDVYIGLKQINSMTNSIHNSIDNFKTFHQLVSKGDDTKSRFNLKQAIYETVILIDEGFSRYSIDIDVQVSKSVTIQGSQALLKQVVLAILIHSKEMIIRHHIDPRRIHLSARQDSLGITLSIKHSGFELDKERAFDDNYDLSFVKDIVDNQLEAKISVASMVDIVTQEEHTLFNILFAE
jgi:DNA-binding NarL/FixJ family response regulator